MMVSLRAEPDPGRSLGHARIVLQGMAQPPGDASFCIQREGYPSSNLGQRGWQVREERLTPMQVLQEGGDTVLVVGPAVTRHLEPAPFIFLLPGAGLEQALFWPDTIEFFDGDLPPEAPQPPPEPPRPPPPPETVVADPPPIKATAPPVVTPPQPNPPPIGQTVVTPPPNRLPLLLGLGGVLLAVAGGAAWFLTGDRPAPPPVATPVAPPPATPAPTPAPTLVPAPPAPAASWLERTEGMALRELVDTAPDAAGIHAAALRRQAAGRHDDALVLFEEAAERGHAPALTALARLYDPNGFVAGRPFRNPDPRAAARYYRDAVQKGDAAAAAPRAALRTMLEDQARSGNGTAETALREFWP